MNSKFFRWYSLKTRVTLFTLAIFVASIWAVSLYASRTMQDNMQRVLGEQQFATVSVVAADIKAELGDHQQALERIAVDISPAIFGSPKALQALLAQRPVFQLLFNAGSYVTGLDGIVIAEFPASGGRIGINFLNDANSAYLLEALKGKSIVGAPFVGRVLKAPVVPMATPIRDSQGQVIGSLVGVINLGMPNFLDRITQARYGRTGGYMLISRPNRMVVTATDRSRIMTVLPGTGVNLLFDRYMQGLEGFGRIQDSRGLEVLSSAKQIPAAGWLLVAELPAEEAFVPIYDMQRRILLAALLLTLVAGGLTWWMLLRQLAPMVAAATTLAAMAQANQPPHPLSITRHDEVGELIGGFNRLIETLAQREAALQKSENNLAITLNSIGEAVIATDSSGCITSMNPTAERLCGWMLADAMGHPLAEVFCIINAATLEPVADPVQLVMAGGEVVDLANHTLLLAKDGRAYQIADSAAPIRNTAGEIVGVVLVFSDVTEQYRAQEALRAGEKRFRSYFDQPLVGIAITSPEKGWIEANEHLCKMLGYSNDELVRLTWAEFTHPDDLAADVMQFERVLR
ncbi:MAG: PAS domain S-box protein, partial [Comamonadaceae bacterium]